MIIFNKIEDIRKKRGSVAVALIDPDKEHDDKLERMLDLINHSDFDIIFVGGSSIADNLFNSRLQFIKKKSDLPLIIFPGSCDQISKFADAILYLSLISGRNPQFLIEEHVKAAPIIHSLSIEAIPTAYILLDGGNRSSVQIASDTIPIPLEKHEEVLAHSLAGQFLGKIILFLECGSGAIKHASCELLQYIKPHLKIPIIVGGGIRTAESAAILSSSGADYVVIGSKIEELPHKDELYSITKAIHKG